jgi:uncharacterized coiled-coil DUF342 family protein
MITDKIAQLKDRLDEVSRETWYLIDQRDEIQERIDELQHTALELQRELSKALEEANEA